MKNNLLKIILPVGLFTTIFYAPLLTSFYLISRIENVGNGVDVLEIGNQILYSYNGLGYIDEGKDGTLDKVVKSMPVGPFMGGPGFALFEVPRTDNDQTNFNFAVNQYNQFKANKK